MNCIGIIFPDGITEFLTSLIPDIHNRPDCGKKIYIFGESHIDEVAKEHGLSVLARIPIDPKVAELTDAGKIEYADTDYMDRAVSNIIAIDKAVEG